MSVRVSTKVWESSQQTGDRLLLMLAMADFADETGVCWPSQKSLAAKIRCSVRWVQKMLSDLRKAGEIQVTKQGLGRGQNTEYQIVFCAPLSPSEKANTSCVLNGEKANVESTNSMVVKGELCDGKDELHNTKGERSVRTNHHRTVRNRQESSVEDLKLPFDSPDFTEAWGEWQEFRVQKREKLTPMTIKHQLAMLAKLGKAGAIECLQNSIRAGWTGLFEPKGNPPSKPKKQSDFSTML